MDSQARKPVVALILPCYNPPLDWEIQVANAFIAWARQLPQVHIRLVIVNDGSRKHFDPSAQKRLESVITDVIWHSYSENQGKGHALRVGVSIFPADYYLYTDIDFPYCPESMTAIAELLLSGKCDIAAGIKDSSYYSQTPFLRKAVSQLLRGMTRLLLGMPESDTQCGLKGFNEKGKVAFMRATIQRYLFDLEFLWMACRDPSLRVAFYPVHLREGVRFSSIHPGMLIREGWSFVGIVCRKWWGHMRISS